MSSNRTTSTKSAPLNENLGQTLNRRGEVSSGVGVSTGTSNRPPITNARRPNFNNSRTPGRLAAAPPVNLTTFGGGDAPTTSTRTGSNPLSNALGLNLFASETFQPKLRGRNTTTKSSTTSTVSPYFRGLDETGLSIDRPYERHLLTRGKDLPLLSEDDIDGINEEIKKSKELLDKTAEHTFYSTRLKYGKTSTAEAGLPTNFEEVNDILEKDFDPFAFRLPSAEYYSKNGIESSAPIDNPKFKIPPTSAKKKPKSLPKVSARSRNYKAVYGSKEMVADDDNESSNESSESNDGNDSTEEEEEESSSSSSGESDEQSSEEEDEDEIPKKGKNKSKSKLKLKNEISNLKKKLQLEYRVGEQLLKDKNYALDQRKAELKKMNLMRSESEENFKTKGFLEDLLAKPFVDKELNKLKSQLNSMPKLNALGISNEQRTAAKPKVKPLKKTKEALLPVKSVKQAPGNNKNQKLSPKSIEKVDPHADVKEIVENIKNLKQDILKVLPAKSNSNSKKFLMGNKSFLTTSPTNISSSSSSNSPVHGRRFTAFSATKTGLTPAARSSYEESPGITMDPLDDAIKKSIIGKNRKLDKVKIEADNLKQKLGIRHEKSSLSTISKAKAVSISGNGINMDDSIYSVSKLRFPEKDIAAGKIARQEFQARDAEMVAARRRAVLEKLDQKKNKYLLTQEEIKAKIHTDRPSMLLKPTKIWAQKTAETKSERLASTILVKSTKNPNEFTRINIEKEPDLFKPSLNILTIPKRASPAWKSI